MNNNKNTVWITAASVETSALIIIFFCVLSASIQPATGAERLGNTLHPSKNILWPAVSEKSAQSQLNLSLPLEEAPQRKTN